MTVRPLLYAAIMLAVQPTAGCADDGGSSEPTVDRNADGDDGAAAVNPREYDHLIVVFGDSLYAGYGLEQNEGFAPELQRALAEQGLLTRVVNAGVSGDTTAAGLQRLAFTLDGLERAPDLVIVGLGGNDMLRGISPEQTRANLGIILEELESRNIDSMLTGMLAAPNLGQEYADAFNPIYADLAAEYDVTLYPFFLEGVIQRPELMLPDGIHPTAEGIDVVVDNIDEMVTAEIAGE